MSFLFFLILLFLIHFFPAFFSFTFILLFILSSFIYPPVISLISSLYVFVLYILCLVRLPPDKQHYVTALCWSVKSPFPSAVRQGNCAENRRQSLSRVLPGSCPQFTVLRYICWSWSMAFLRATSCIQGTYCIWQIPDLEASPCRHKFAIASRAESLNISWNSVRSTLSPWSYLTVPSDRLFQPSFPLNAHTSVTFSSPRIAGCDVMPPNVKSEIIRSHTNLSFICTTENVRRSLTGRSRSRVLVFFFFYWGRLWFESRSGHRLSYCVISAIRVV